MKSDLQSSNLHVPSESALTQAGKVALTFLEETGQTERNQAVQVFRHMAQIAAERGHELSNIEFETVALKEIVAANTLKGASAWMSPLWKQLEDRQESWGPGLRSTAIQMGYRFTPKLRKLHGSPAKYQLTADPVEIDAGDRHPTPTPDGGIRYTPAAVAAPGAVISAGLRGGVVRHTLPLIVSTSVFVTVAVFLLLFSAWWLVVTGLRSNSPLSTAHVSYTVMWCFVSWVVWRVFKFMSELAELGIVLAPEFLVPFKEDHVTLELQPRDGNKTGAFAFVRYTATCPQCKGRVLLHDGGEEFKGRIVGRCGNSPREQVFSFDQRLHVGRPMRG
ncbi:hypothetical protein [Hydrogenophaga sp. T2]|uniref:hypothetical protein n=1 Tax=Hydrogenophaga sp. T2 TaxID=3132823 RepID=UPI003CE72C5E